jgi:hypothetical protein
MPTFVPYPVQIVMHPDPKVEEPVDDEGSTIVNMGVNNGCLDIWIETPDGEASMTLTPQEWADIKRKADELFGVTGSP